MQYRQLGSAGVRVSTIGLGTNQFGGKVDQTGVNNILDAALDLGINLLDTADVYQQGRSEETLGVALAGRWDKFVLATKFCSPMGQGTNDKGASRYHIMAGVEASLRRLQSDYIDLYQIHRWDDATPIEETMEALHDVVRAGKARYLGASSMYAWQLAKAQHVAERHGWTRFVSMQNHYNLVYREEERETLPLCRDQGMGVIPWSPLARGKLARPPQATTTKRSETDRFGKTLYSSMAEADERVIAAVDTLAKARDLPHAQVALAWVLQKEGVTAPIVGATKMEHLETAVASLDVKLSPEEMKALEAPYVPHPTAGF